MPALRALSPFSLDPVAGVHRVSRRLLLAAALTVLFTINPWPADGHLVRHPDAPTLNALENRERSQQRNLHHSRYVCERGRRANRRWHCAAAVWIARELRQTREQLAGNLAPIPAILHVFGEHGAAAVDVARCETGGSFSVYARNGQYLGLFQVSEHWRNTIPGFGFTPLEQARHAYRVFQATGYSWSHWECKP